MLAEHGYDRCSIEAVADEAGVTRATVYRRYPTKADLVTNSVCAMEKLPDGSHMPDTRACLAWMLGEFRDGIDSCRRRLDRVVAVRAAPRAPRHAGQVP